MKLSRSILAIAAAGSLALAGCSSEEAKDTVSSATESATSAASEASETASDAASEATDAAKATLADWDGTYRSLGSYIDDADMEEAFTKAAEEHGESLDELKDELKESYGLPYEGLVVDGETITFVKNKDELDSPSEEPVDYEFLESVDKSFNGKDFTWYVFEAKGDAENKYVLLMPKHGEETLEHFHARFGDDKDALLDAENFPTFVNPDNATQAQIEEELLEHAH
ncbi:Metal-binding protein ZinT precursor [Corynebacterium ciconiae DSM 44920]|uniref:ZinT/AdcA family metal-binding protein n=1 Tax=Corynebacterium ciconiae TaxID=227319 RepID=UPI00037B7040|nr:ZinT/AdcA family metal-binding protein [Corynebacterium ciconiae]WKD60729.1 Metal-binding protein ZinT precursor [Corynebacterium ciconiae DSM 44920]